jgi:hypothetical protein
MNAQKRAAATDVPIDVLESILREYIADRTAEIIACDSAPFPNQGTNDSTTFWRVTFTWRRLNPSMELHTTTWIIKHWKAGGARDGTLGINQPHEVLAWEQGWLRPNALPSRLTVPFISARHTPDYTEAWLAMADVSTELSAYSRMRLAGDQAISHTRAILARLAQFHARWEQPEYQAKLQAGSWLRPAELSLWDMASTYARALGHTPVAYVPRGASHPSVWDGLAADLDAFLEGRPADERRLWEYLLTDRRALVEGLAGFPQTLLHNDLDDRNIGLRWSGGDVTDLVLIDWEWMAVGPAALDVANLVQHVPVMITLGAPIPESIWTDTLADHYFAHYRAAGGRCVDTAAWRRAYGLAVVAKGIAQMPSIQGALRRAIRGEIPPPQIIGVPEQVIRQNLRAGLPMMERMEQRVIHQARMWLT